MTVNVSDGLEYGVYMGIMMPQRIVLRVKGTKKIRTSHL